VEQDELLRHVVEILESRNSHLSACGLSGERRDGEPR